MNTLMVRLGSAVLFLLMGTLGGCATSSEVGVKYSITYEPSGMPKYDNFLETSQNLVAELDTANHAIENLVPSLKQAGSSMLEAAGTVGDLAALESSGNVLKALTANLASAKIVLYLHDSASKVELRVKSSGGDPEVVEKVQAALGNVNKALDTIAQVRVSLGKVGGNVKSLVTQAQELVASAPNDFTGMDVMKLPGVAASLSTAATELANVPGRVVTLTESAGKLLKDFQSLAGQ
jgi:uncharacterized protein YoxC